MTFSSRVGKSKVKKYIGEYVKNYRTHFRSKGESSKWFLCEVNKDCSVGG